MTGAGCRYLYHLERELEKRGFEFVWGESVVCIMVDFHYGSPTRPRCALPLVFGVYGYIISGKASGLLKRLITKFGMEEGTAMYTKLLARCFTHLTKALNDKINQSRPTWRSALLPDVGLTGDSFCCGTVIDWTLLRR